MGPPLLSPEHDAEVHALWAAFARRGNDRVPITFACDEQAWLKAAGETFGRFYADPRVHLSVQLRGRHWFATNVIGDMRSALPDAWPVVTQLWMYENEFFGCEVVYQEDEYAWALPLRLGRADLLRHIADLDPEERARCNSAFRMYEAIRELADGLEYEGRPVTAVPPGGGTHGLFTKAVEIRGAEQLCLDLYEAPAFVDELMRLVTEKTIARIRVFRRLTGQDHADQPSATGFHFCDDSLDLISPQTYERFVLPWHEQLYSAFTTGPRAIHLCGHAAQHFDTLYHKLGVTTIDGPGPWVDHSHYLRDFGEGFSFQAQLDHTVLERGSPAQIDAMMHDLLQPGCRIPGRFQVMGFVSKHTPLDNVRHCYEAGRTYGAITAT